MEKDGDTARVLAAFEGGISFPANSVMADTMRARYTTRSALMRKLVCE
jgi:hypothetical protein